MAFAIRSALQGRASGEQARRRPRRLRRRIGYDPVYAGTYARPSVGARQAVETGAVVLSGDAVHFRDNFEARRVPSMNTDADKTLASMQKIADVMAKEHAQLWINHDKAQRDTLKLAPEFYE